MAGLPKRPRKSRAKKHISAQDFATDVEGFAEASEVKLTEVWHGALRGLDDALASLTPVVTGNLRNSRDASNDGPVTTEFKTRRFRNPDDKIDNTIAGAEVGGKMWLGFRAPYAYKVEARHGMVRLAAQRWKRIVDEAAAEARD